MRSGLHAVLLLGLGVLTAPVAVADDAEVAAVAAVKKLGGTVRLDDTAADRPVVGVILSLTPCKDSDLKQLAGLKSLQSLALYRTQVTDAGLKERSEEHTSELQSLRHLVCRLLLEKKKKK